jgi:geranylgeranyl pyrophosphate synthase
MDLERAHKEVDRALEACISEELEDAPPAIASPIRYAVLGPGKRIRPLLVIASWEAVRGESVENTKPALYRLACAPELVHAYSLIHDDLPCMDDDNLRRGRPTVHVSFGVRGAILAGGALMPIAVGTIGSAADELGVGLDVKTEMIKTLVVASGGAGMVGGQLLDIEAEGGQVDLHTLEGIHLGKTARLISASCVIGALAAGGGPAVIERLANYGLRVGLAFQAVDDILDVIGSTEQLGKFGGRDQVLGKVTTPSVLGLPGAKERAAQLGNEAIEELDLLPNADGLRQITRLILDRDR